MPVSSSAHLEMIPRLAGWDWEQEDPEIRKAFEVALHAGTALALLLVRRRELATELARLDRRRASVLILSFLPAAALGYGFERVIERSLGGPLPTAAGLAAGGVAMALADRRPQERDRGEAGPLDGLVLGLAQATALIPGVSRNGATLTAARWRKFTRVQANALSRSVALPVIAGASLLKGVRLARRGVGRRELGWMAAGFAASLVSTVASSRLVEQVERDRPLAPFTAYRIAFAILILARLGSGPESKPARDEHRPVDGVESTAVRVADPETVTE